MIRPEESVTSFERRYKHCTNSKTGCENPGCVYGFFSKNLIITIDYSACLFLLNVDFLIYISLANMNAAKTVTED